MDRGMVIYLGALPTFSSSWLGLILIPYWQLRGEQPYQKDAADEPYPRPLEGQAAAGRRVYQQNGCMYCHSQQIRSERFGNWWEDGQEKTGADIKAAKEVGLLIASRAIKAGLKEVVFDRGGYIYHGRVKALADGAREGGLSF